MAETSLATRASGTLINSYDEAERAAKAMAASGFFADSRNAAQAVVKILAGQEMGFGPFASMNGVYIISGRPSIGANLMAAAVKKSGRYNYRITEMTEKVCSITFLEHGKEIGVSTFTAEDARKAGTKNMDKYARNMLFARAMSNGVRWYCPDVFNGSTVYTPEELGATVNEDGEVIDLPVTTSQPSGKVSAIPETITTGSEAAQDVIDGEISAETSRDQEPASLNQRDFWNIANPHIKAKTITPARVNEIEKQFKPDWKAAIETLNAETA